MPLGITPFLSLGEGSGVGLVNQGPGRAVGNPDLRAYTRVQNRFRVLCLAPRVFCVMNNAGLERAEIAASLGLSGGPGKCFRLSNLIGPGDSATRWPPRRW